MLKITISNLIMLAQARNKQIIPMKIEGGMRLKNQLSLARQVDLAFWNMKDELCQLGSGTVIMQIRNNAIGKFGIRHLPMESKGGHLLMNEERGLSEAQFVSFKGMAIDCLRYKKNWTHGEMMFDFTIKSDTLLVSVQFESNYNMANLSNSG
jgi:hypothetical protein